MASAIVDTGNMATLSAETLKIVRKRNTSLQRIRDRERAARDELRRALVAAREDGHSLASIGEQLGVSAQRVDQLIRAGN